MAKIHTLKIKNFRGIKEFEQVFGKEDFVCIIGRGDSGKTTILEAINYVLYPNWNLQMYDTDFYECNITKPIEISVSLYDIPERFKQENKFGLYARTLKDGAISDNIEGDSDEFILSIKLVVDDTLEPKWFVFTDREQDDIEIKSSDRALLNVFFVSDYIDRHFSWNNGSPLLTLLKQNDGDHGNENVLVNAFREAKNKIDEHKFTNLEPVLTTLKEKSTSFGVDLSNINTTIDFRDIYIRDGKICLHEENIPFRMKGKGTKRLTSFTIQHEIVSHGGIVLIDEIEQGLEPDRVQNLVKMLKNNNKGQIFITTHSRNTVVQLSYKNLFLMRRNATNLMSFDNDMQGCLRANPEAFFAKKVLVCEGSTEVGICFAIDNYRVDNKLDSASFHGVVFVNGGGSKFIEYTNNFYKSGYKVGVFCDSDEKNANNKKDELRAIGIKNIFECEDNNCIEKQVFKDLPWDGIKELVQYRIDKGIEEYSIKQSVESKLSKKLSEDWLTLDDLDVRKALSEVSIISKKEWFKSIEGGIFLGSIICKYMDELSSKKIGQIFDSISNWIGND